MTTAFQPNAFQPDAFQVEGGVASGEITGGLAYTNRNDTFAGSAQLGGEDLTAPKYGARKRKANPNIRFKPATVAKAAPKVEKKPEQPKPKASPLILGLMARGLAPPEPAAPVPPAAAPVLVVASIPPAVLAEPVPAPIEALAPAAPAITLEQLAGTVQSLEQQLQALRDELERVRQASRPEPVAATARDPVHEALHAILPGLGDPIDLDAEPPALPEPVAAAAPAAPTPAAATAAAPLTAAQIRAENERRAAIAVRKLLMNV